MKNYKDRDRKLWKRNKGKHGMDKGLKRVYLDLGFKKKKEKRNGKRIRAK